MSIMELRPALTSLDKTTLTETTRALLALYAREGKTPAEARQQTIKTYVGLGAALEEMSNRKSSTEFSFTDYLEKSVSKEEIQILKDGLQFENFPGENDLWSAKALFKDRLVIYLNDLKAGKFPPGGKIPDGK